MHEPQPLGLKDPVFRIMSRDFFRYMRSEPFSQLIGGRRVADLLGDAWKPLLVESLELTQLIKDRHIEFELEDSYAESSFQLHAADEITRTYAYAIARRRPVDKSFSAVTKTLTRLDEANREAYRFQFMYGTHEARACAQMMISIDSLFFRAYATALYMRAAFAKLLEQGNDRGIVQQLVSADLYWRTILHRLSPNISGISAIFTDASGLLLDIVRGMKTVECSVPPLPSHLEELQEMCVAGVEPVDSFVQLRMQHGLLQCLISPLSPEWRSHESSGIPKGLAEVQFLMVPQEHTGYYQGSICTIDGEEGHQHGLTMVLRGTGKLFINLVPLDVLLPPDIAKYLETQMIQLAYEASTGSYEIGMVTPQVPPATSTVLVPEYIQSDPEDDDDEFRAKLPRDIRGVELIAAIHSMNRTFYRDQGMRGTELDAQANPLLRQKGSHAVIFCAETNRIAPVPVHSVALRVGTLKSILRMLRLEPARLMEAI